MERAGTERGGALFAALAAAPPRTSSFGGAGPASVFFHAAALALLLVPLSTATTPPRPERDYLGVLLYDPAPPPAPPLPLGNGAAERATRVSVRTDPATPALTAPLEEATAPEPVAPTEAPTADAPAGSPTGHALGVAEGLETGQPAGVVGGLPDGVRDGVIGGTGRVPVPVTRFDRPPQRVHMVEPVYPPEAFAKKIQGTVELQILIDAEGHVARATVMRSIPQLDAAAIEAARQWIFKPATRDGRPVESLATAPVRFSIY
ncbi:MAG: energy transducer TonB [Vicinamibacteria bacterium]